MKRYARRQINQYQGAKMKLYITRNQSKKLMEGVSFELSARTELSNDGANIVKNDKVEKEVLLQNKSKFP